MSHLETVNAIYEAWGQGDVDGVLAHCVASPEWEYGVTSTDVPWLQHQTDRDGAAKNMRAGGEEIEIQQFVPKSMLEGEDVVVVLLDIEFVVKRTGKSVVEVDAVQIWRFDGSGKVSQFRQRVDTHQQQLAWTD